jgi:hypothetical protein
MNVTLDIPAEIVQKLAPSTEAPTARSSRLNCCSPGRRLTTDDSDDTDNTAAAQKKGLAF